MNERQRTVAAVAAVALIVAALFFVPWRIEATGEIKWAPFYRPPVSYTVSYAEGQGSARYTYQPAEVAVGFLLLELLAVAAAGGAAWFVARDAP